MEIQEAIEKRRSCRGFNPAPVPRDVLEKVLNSARWSPSYTNSQPWEVAVVSGKKLAQLSRQLLEQAKDTVPGKPDVPFPRTWLPVMVNRRDESASMRLKALGIDRDDVKGKDEVRLLNYKFYGAPCALFVMMDETLSSYSIFDIGLFTGNVTMAAQASGLGTCIQASTVIYPELIRTFLGIPKNKCILLSIAVGYPDPTHPLNSYRVPRNPITDFVSWYD